MDVGISTLTTTYEEIHALVNAQRFAMDLLLSEIDALNSKMIWYRAQSDALAQKEADLRERLVSQQEQLKLFPEEVREAAAGGAAGNTAAAQVGALLAEKTVYQMLEHKVQRRFRRIVRDHAGLARLRNQDMRDPEIRAKAEATISPDAVAAKKNIVRQAVAEVEEGIRGDARRGIREHLYGTMKTFAHNPRGMLNSLMFNFVLLGRAGTGKSQVATVMARWFFAVGIFVTDRVHVITRSDLVAGYVGQSAPKTRARVYSALEGVILLDEAYSLLSCEYKEPGDPGSGVSKRDQFGLESIDQLTEMLTSLKGKVCVIVAGYEKEMRACFLEANSGLDRRFPNKWVLGRFSRDDLRQLLTSQLQRIDNTSAFWFQSGRQMFTSKQGHRVEDFITLVQPLLYALDAMDALTAQAGDTDILANLFYNALALGQGELTERDLVDVVNGFLTDAKNNTTFRVVQVAEDEVLIELAEGEERVIDVREPDSPGLG